METKISGGYILLSRKIIESEIWEKPPIYLKVWMYLLMKAQYKPYKNLERGQLVISIPEIMEACSHKVGYRTEKPSKSQIFNVLEWLRSSDEGSHEDNANETMIDTTKTTRGMLVNVSNYSFYQDPKSYEQNDEDNDEKVTTETMPKRQADTINKNVKNLRIKELADVEEANVENPFMIYEQNFGVLKPILRDSLISWCEDLGDEVVIAGMKLAAQKGGRSFSYIESIWKEWVSVGLKTVDQVRTYENQKKKVKNNVTPFKPKQKIVEDDGYDYGF